MQSIATTVMAAFFGSATTEDIRFEENPTSYEVKVGEHSVLLVCSAVGLPLPAISWRFNKVKVPDGRSNLSQEPLTD